MRPNIAGPGWPTRKRLGNPHGPAGRPKWNVLVGQVTWVVDRVVSVIGQAEREEGSKQGRSVTAATVGPANRFAAAAQFVRLLKNSMACFMAPGTQLMWSPGTTWASTSSPFPLAKLAVRRVGASKKGSALP